MLLKVSDPDVRLSWCERVWQQQLQEEEDQTREQEKEEEGQQTSSSLAEAALNVRQIRIRGCIKDEKAQQPRCSCSAAHGKVHGKCMASQRPTVATWKVFARTSKMRALGRE